MRIHIFSLFVSILGNPNFTVLPSSRILVNDSVDLKCEFNNTQPGAFFFFPLGVICPIAFSNNTCHKCIDWKTSCPDEKVYTVKAYAQITWNTQTLSCSSFSSTEKGKGISEIFDVKVPVSDVHLTSGQDAVNVGQPMTLTCQTNYCNPQASIKWYKGTYPISSGIDIKFDKDTNNLQRTTSILMYRFNADDNGLQVHCTASNSLDKTVVSENHTLDLKYAPPTDPLLTALTSTKVDEDKSVSLQCSLTTLGNPPIKWSWMCGDVDLTLNATNTTTRSTLTFTAKKEYNQKTCQCRATSPRASLTYNRPSNNTLITVYYAPSTDPSLKVLSSPTVNESSPVALQCNVPILGNPSILWSWVCGNDDLTVNATKNGTQSTLTFTAKREYNKRTCLCWARSSKISLSYNRPSRNQTITVYYPPSENPYISSSSRSFVFTSGDSVNLTCIVIGGNPIANLSWNCSSNNLETETHNNSTLGASVLFLKVDKKFNNRDCTCIATHPLQTKIKSEKLIVYYPSNITTTFEEIYRIDEKQNISIKCYVDANPLSNITWKFSKTGTVLNSTYNSSNGFLEIPSVKCSDHGQYIVVATNGIGISTSKSTEVKVNCKPRLFTADSQTPDKIGIGNNESLIISVRLLLYPPASTFKWEFTGSNNLSYVIENNKTGYKIASISSDNEHNITLFKQNVSEKEFGSYNLTITNSVGTFTKTYKVNGARSPLPPFNLTLDCGNPDAIILTWIADFNGGDKQTFHIFSSSGENNSSFKELTTVDDKGFGQTHSYSPSEKLYGQFWFRISASNKFGNSITDGIPCFIKTPDESPNSTAMLAGIAAGGGVCLAFVVIVVVVYFRKYHKYEKSAKHIERLNNVNENEEDGADVDGLKENSLYVSAGPKDDEKPEVAVYAAVAKKLPQSDDNSNLYADVKKSGRQETNKGTMSSEVKPKKGLFKKDGKAKHKKGKKPNNRPGEADVYENSEDIAMSTNVDNVYSNAAQKGQNKQKERGYKNKDGLLYVEVNFDGKQGQDNPVIHGEDEKTDYATVEFPMPSALHKASGSEEL